MSRAGVIAAATLLIVGCGSIGTPLPPALHIPQRVVDLSAAQQGDKIVVQFTLPIRTTENLIIQKPITADLGIGPAASPFIPTIWAAGAKHFTDLPTDKPSVKYAAPGSPWIGQEVVIAVQILGDKDRSAGWSNPVTLSVVPPLPPPGLRRCRCPRESGSSGKATRRRIAFFAEVLGTKSRQRSAKPIAAHIPTRPSSTTKPTVIPWKPFALRPTFGLRARGRRKSKSLPRTYGLRLCRAGWQPLRPPA